MRKFTELHKELSLGQTVQSPNRVNIFQSVQTGRGSPAREYSLRDTFQYKNQQHYKVSDS